MYLIPQPKNIEFGEPGSHFTLSYGSYVCLLYTSDAADD